MDTGSNWDDLVAKSGRYKPRLYRYVVKWKLPKPGRMKCNTDEAAKGNPGQAFYGFVLKRDDGSFIYAQAGKLGITTNMVEKITAILEAVKYCTATDVTEVKIESDSLMMVNFIRKVWTIPWELTEAVEVIRTIMININVTISHIYREGNKLADALANLTFQSEDATIITQLPADIRKIMNIDIKQIPNLRIRIIRIKPNVKDAKSDKLIFDSSQRKSPKTKEICIDLVHQLRRSVTSSNQQWSLHCLKGKGGYNFVSEDEAMVASIPVVLQIPKIFAFNFTTMTAQQPEMDAKIRRKKRRWRKDNQQVPWCLDNTSVKKNIEDGNNINHSQEKQDQLGIHVEATRFYNNVDDEIVENEIEELKKEKERFFFEGGKKNSSIFEVSSSKNNGGSNTFEFQPYSNSSWVMRMMNSMDPFGNSKKSKGKTVEANQGIERDYNKLMKEVVESSSKSDNTSSNRFEYIPFNDTSVIALMDSVNPYEDFKKSMMEMLKANQQTKDCEKCLEELLIWYLKSNGKNNHRCIIDAFFDVLNGYTSSTNTTSYSHSFTNSSFFGSTPSVSASPPFLSLLEVVDEIVDENTTTRRFSI
ncbi:hypothetical protein CQW23_24583 [Capsicum baccatum]|uniref:Transcription repressor n=1 Tax=Capsicum baccatum TaxID=33114 RepID=A0A2G2VVB9_CAPBA|nr:hypothetical protein CQW23_24583 [Capsicum baccatum]